MRTRVTTLQGQDWIWPQLILCFVSIDGAFDNVKGIDVDIIKLNIALASLK